LEQINDDNAKSGFQRTRCRQFAFRWNSCCAKAGKKHQRAAQVANEFDMNGHAAEAKELLEQASKELKEAAEAANENAK